MMNTTQECVIFIIGCMTLFQLVDWIFNSFIQALFLNLDFVTMDFSIAHKNVKFLSFVTTIHDFCMSCFLGVLSQELKYWVKPRSTTWLSKFSIIEYKDDQWVENFKMSKSTLFWIVDKLKLTLFNKNTKYKQGTLVKIHMYCVIYKLAHG